MRVVLTGGGTGGHLLPFEPIVDVLRTVHSEQKDDLPKWIDANKLEIFFLGVADEKTREFFKELGVPVTNIPAGKLRRYPSARTFIDLFIRIPYGTLLSLFYMWMIMPDVIISKGGYGSIPVSLAAVFYRIPVLLHESDAVFGLANQLMAGFASAITVSFSNTRKNMTANKSKTLITGTPTRAIIGSMDKGEAKKHFGFSEDEKVLLVMGGSQGSQEINEVLLHSLNSLIGEMGIIHLSGTNNVEWVKKQADELIANKERRSAYKLFGYLTDEMPAALAAADVVVGRAGATSLTEMAKLRKPSIVIPLDSAAQDHQRENARLFESAGAVRVIDPVNLGRALFEQNVRDLISNEGVRETLSNNIGNMDRPEAARDIVKISFKLARDLVPRQTKASDK